VASAMGKPRARSISGHRDRHKKSALTT